MKIQRELNEMYQKEPREYIQSEINKVKNLIEDKQSRISW